MKCYRLCESEAEALAIANAAWDAYYARECAARGLRHTVDSLDRKEGRPLPLAQAVTQHCGCVRTIAGVPLLEVPGDEITIQACVQEADLPTSVRDALAAEKALPG